MINLDKCVSIFIISFCFLDQTVKSQSKVTLDWPMVAHHMREELKYVTTGSGGQCVMMPGVEMTLE